MQIIKIFCYSHMRSIYCKFLASKIEQHQPTTNQKKQLLQQHHQKTRQKSTIKKTLFKKNFKKKCIY